MSIWTMTLLRIDFGIQSLSNWDNDLCIACILFHMPQGACQFPHTGQLLPC